MITNRNIVKGNATAKYIQNFEPPGANSSVIENMPVINVNGINTNAYIDISSVLLDASAFFLLSSTALFDVIIFDSAAMSLVMA